MSRSIVALVVVLLVSCSSDGVDIWLRCDVSQCYVSRGSCPEQPLGIGVYDEPDDIPMCETR